MTLVIGSHPSCEVDSSPIPSKLNSGTRLCSSPTKVTLRDAKSISKSHSTDYHPPRLITIIRSITLSKESEDMKNILHLLLKNNIVYQKENNEKINVPRYDTKRGRELYDKASVRLPANKRYDLKQ